MTESWYVVPFALFVAPLAWRLIAGRAEEESVRARSEATLEAARATRRFFERTGYRFADLGAAPLDAHVEYAIASGPPRFLAPDLRVHLVRELEGHTIHFRHETKPGARAGELVTSCTWTLELASPPSVRWQVAETELGRPCVALANALSPRRIEWHAEDLPRVESGDEVLDGRFQMRASDEDELQRVLADPALRAHLSAARFVDLRVRDGEIVFFDPDLENLRDAMGGTGAMVASAREPARLLARTVPAHDRIAAILLAAARLSA